jgi:predicted nucleic acid-binding Zn finger protein
LNDKAQTLSYEHYYPYGGTAIIAGKDKTQTQQKRYRYTGKERDDSSGLSYCQCAECCFVVLLGWLKGLVKVGSLFDFVFGG